MKVSFLIAGTQKGGTTSLDAWLRQHPGLVMATRKEPHHFDNDGLFADGATPPGHVYAAHFPASPSGLPRGEATPITLWWPNALRRAQAYNPEFRIIVLLRCPLQRAWSHWRMERARGKDSLGFTAAVAGEEARI